MANEMRHHFPANDCTRQTMRDAYVDTKGRYEEIFGVAPSNKIWPEAGATCGDSYSGLISEEQAGILEQA